MLTYLFLAKKQGFVIDSYVDEAVGVLSKNESGRMWVSKVTLGPAIAYSGDKRPTTEQSTQLHHAAHEQCFIASSVKTEVAVVPRDA
jgi:organic hydroperoxide reductase OsmC/OhrA